MRFIPPGVIFTEEPPLTSAVMVNKKKSQADYVRSLASVRRAALLDHGRRMGEA